MHRHPRCLPALSLTLLASALFAADPVVAPAYRSRLVLESLGPLVGNPTQLAWGPDSRLYVRTTGDVQSYAYDRRTGQLSDRRQAVAGVPGIGLAFHRKQMYLTGFDGSIRRLDDKNGNGIWGEKSQGERNVAIVTRLPVGSWAGDHHVDQLAVRGDTLFVGIGQRTNNGHTGAWTMGSLSDDPGDRGFWNGGTGWSWGESVYGGTIGWIQDLTRVPDGEGAANTYEDTRITRALIQDDDAPLNLLLRMGPLAVTNRLLIHSAGARNPFGLCLDRDGRLWFTNNFDRTLTQGDGQPGPPELRDQEQADFARAVHDQVFRAVEGADYGFTNENWRPKNPMLDPTAPEYRRALSATFDNLFNPGPYTLHNPAEPDGLGPNSAATGCAFYDNLRLPEELRGNLFLTRWTHDVTERAEPGDPVRHTLTYADLVAVQPVTGKVRRVAQEFENPIALLPDSEGRLLVADHNGGPEGGRLYALRPAVSRLEARASLARTAQALVATVSLTNAGDLTATSIRIQQGMLGFRGTITALPLTVGTIRPGETRTATLRFAPDLRAGAVTAIKVYGAYSGGPFALAQRVIVP